MSRAKLVARAKARCIEIYRSLTMRDGENRTRILRVLDKYSLECSILPTAIEDLMTRECAQAKCERVPGTIMN